MESDTVIIGPPFGRQTILLVDDNPDDVFIMRNAFKKAEVSNPLQTVGDGEEAVSYLKGEGIYVDRRVHPFPIVMFLDLNMPRKNGLEVLAWIREQNEPRLKHLTVHILTASTRLADVDRAFELGANSYLVKPSRVEDLLQLIRAWHCLTRFSGFPVSRTP